MSEHHVGLDIGSFGVRAAEVSVEGGGPVLHRFAQLTLPPGAVVEGEVVDTPAVAATIRELWEKGGFKASKVVVGISTRDVKVRQAEVPALDPDDVRSTLRFEAQDLIPYADADAIVDYIVQGRFVRDGADMLQVLVVAAPRAHIDTTIAAVSAAGLTVEAVDLMPFAVVRSLGGRDDPGAGEVIVGVGAGLTSVVAQAGGVPQMVRTTAGGGGSITEALSQRLSVGYEEAEAIKRTAAPHTPEGATATALIEEQLSLLVREITGSIDYFVAQTPSVTIRRVILTGSGSMVPGLRERIRSETNLEVVPADALRNVGLGKTRLTPEQLVAASTTLAGPIGLALAPLADPSTRLTALLPDAYVRRLAARREAKVSAALVGVLALALMGVWAHRTLAVHDARAAVARSARLQRLVTAKDVAYAPYAAQAADAQRRTTTVKSALATDVDPAAVMDQVSAHLPPDVWLKTFTLTGPRGASPGTMTFSLGGTDPTSPAHWVEAMRALPGLFGKVWISGITVSTANGKTQVAFSSTATFSPGVHSNRAASYVVPK